MGEILKQTFARRAFKIRKTEIDYDYLKATLPFQFSHAN